MAFTINTNLLAMTAQRHLAESQRALETAFERLSSGLRINHASDDPTGIVIADRLRRDQRVAAQGIRNANDGISLLSIGDQALGQIGDILTRMSELASQSSSGIVTDAERVHLQSEFADLIGQIDRLANGAGYNGISVLNAASTLAIQVGLDGTAASRINIATVNVTSAQLLGAIAPAIDTQANAQAAIAPLTTAIQTVASTRGAFGSGENRLLAAIDALRVTQDSYATAESRIRDADVAAETAALTRAQILQSAGVALLAQANQQAKLVLELLK
jgi:flagellin